MPSANKPMKTEFFPTSPPCPWRPGCCRSQHAPFITAATSGQIAFVAPSGPHCCDLHRVLHSTS
jgi:hypothetical protein